MKNKKNKNIQSYSHLIMYKIWDKYLKKNMSCDFAMKNWHLIMSL